MSDADRKTARQLKQDSHFFKNRTATFLKKLKKAGQPLFAAKN
jgi:hypothetical protein